ncbi:MAG: NMD3-related protein, partial [Nanoarchaeota archaeon]
MNLPRSNYYQGILQLRDVNEQILNFVLAQIKNRADVAITRTVRFSNGIDLYITSQKFIRILGKKLKDSFGGELKISSKLHTKNRQGKDLYRVNVLFRLLKYKRGDTVSVRG